jgi:hypothetical protein
MQFLSMKKKKNYFLYFLIFFHNSVHKQKQWRKKDKNIFSRYDGVCFEFNIKNWMGSIASWAHHGLLKNL